jgi:cytochrome c oxidase subunit II
MNKMIKITSFLILGMALIVLLDACILTPRQVGTGWGQGAFDSNGERIYFTATSKRDSRITYSGGPSSGMMMGGGLACASCHGPDAQGGLHTMMGMQVMDAPDIRWDSLADEVDEGHGDEEQGHGEGEYDLELFRLAVVEGKHPDGEPLSEDMPRWDIGDEDLEDLVEYLMSLD